jgi:epoxide hydrolase-like predicted phosphatase
MVEAILYIVNRKSLDQNCPAGLTCCSPRSPTLEYVLDSRDAATSAKNPQQPIRAVVTDWGGVMTDPIRDTVRIWLDDEDIDHHLYAEVMRPWVTGAYEPSGNSNPIHALERGECTVQEFEQALAARLTCRDGSPLSPAGLLGRMFRGSAHCDEMHTAMQAVRGAGLRTGLLSNSWGPEGYPRHLFPDLFDVVVISGEVGMRKPEERIFLHTASLLGLAPAECVFIDDIEANITAAEAVGMTGVLHDDPAGTLARLSEILGLPLAA